ncbi:MAG: hypothetical protein A2751_00470 [Candidatus Doudnabacteria bacterium RIFCSPHIGHO2_01_FULL_46_14]|uniref:Transcriptional regulator n=1 Tax=Candidatus Doudnabacteria bacterium RIFCSPHIGHO2_01_FULL_46_14 TaxID=1817824 RepID=A0A1F5NPQ3_9BACT|nr:MAG: hypothetical protein A2751_00470 [Candidatus Doudnabacteria bacterium RIFCSPHIGHO2_01_FULL_46_14]
MLENLLNTKPKKKILSVFFAHPKRSFSLQELHTIAEVSTRVAGEAVRELVRSEVLSTGTKSRQRLFRVNTRFSLYQELEDLLSSDAKRDYDQVSKILKKLPNAKLVIVSGVFTMQPNLPLDLLVVGDNISRIRLTSLLKEVEKITGMEIVYAVMSVEEYEYRRLMSDRFVRDILDYPHLAIINHLKTKSRSK